MVIKCRRLYKQRRLFRFTRKRVAGQRDRVQNHAASIAFLPHLSKVPKFPEKSETGSDGAVKTCGRLWENFPRLGFFLVSRVSSPETTSAPRGAGEKLGKISCAAGTHTAAVSPLTIQARRQENKIREIKSTFVLVGVGE